MKSTMKGNVRLLIGIAVTCAMMSASLAQTPGGAAPDEGALRVAQAIKTRKAIYTLIGVNFGPLGAALQGKTPFDGAEALKRAERVSFLASLTPEAYPEFSKTGDTKAKPEIWSNRPEFDKHLQDLIEHSNALVATLRKDRNDAAAFKSAATVVAGDCKSCHDDFRAK